MIKNLPLVKRQSSRSSLNLEVWSLDCFGFSKGSFLQNFECGDWFVFAKWSLDWFLLIEMWKTLEFSWIAATFSTEGRILSRSFLLKLTHRYLQSPFLHQLLFQRVQERIGCCPCSKRCNRSAIKLSTNLIWCRVGFWYRILIIQFARNLYLQKFQWLNKWC